MHHSSSPSAGSNWKVIDNIYIIFVVSIVNNNNNYTEVSVSSRSYIIAAPAAGHYNAG
jgi:hypothetical protein